MLGERRSRAGWCADLSEAFKNPDVEETEAATERKKKRDVYLKTDPAQEKNRAG